MQLKFGKHGCSPQMKTWMITEMDFRNYQAEMHVKSNNQSSQHIFCPPDALTAAIDKLRKCISSVAGLNFTTINWISYILVSYDSVANSSQYSYNDTSEIHLRHCSVYVYNEKESSVLLNICYQNSSLWKSAVCAINEYYSMEHCS